MDSFRVLIVDDELQSRSLIRKLLSVHFPSLIIDEADSVASAVKQIQLHSPTLVFLDVQMRGETGFDLLDKIDQPDFEIIFTTAHSEFALKAFRYSALDYLMKPIDRDEFQDAMEKAISRIQKQESTAKNVEFLKELKSTRNAPSKLTVPTADGFLFVTIDDILYCHAVGNYTEFHFDNNHKLVSSYTLGYYSEILTPHNFFRVHRSFLVNLAKIKMYKKGHGGVIVMNNGEEIEVSRNSKTEFLKMLKL
jgi:Response regulator of the LytR/AlgR family